MLFNKFVLISLLNVFELGVVREGRVFLEV